MDSFKLPHLSLDIRGGIGRSHRNTRLKKDPSVIIFLVHQMDSDSGFGFASTYHSLMHMPSVHPFPSELRQKRRMYVDDISGKTFRKKSWQHLQKTGQDYHIHAMAIHQRGNHIRVVDLSTCEHTHRHTQLPAARDNLRIRIIAHHKRDFRSALTRPEISDNIDSVAARTRGEDCYSYHNKDFSTDFSISVSESLHFANVAKLL